MLPATHLPRWNHHAPILAFAPEWLAVASLALAGILLSAIMGIAFHNAPHDDSYLLFGLLAGIVLRKIGYVRAGLFLEYFALVITVYTAIMVLSYDATVVAAPLVDVPFRAADQALGFDWIAWFNFVTAHPPLKSMLRILYYGIGYEAIYMMALMLLLNNVARLCEMFWLLLAAGLIVSVGAWLFPALGPFHQYGMDGQNPFLLEMEHLRTGRDLHFQLEALQGVVCFPSFHTTLALATAYGFRGTGPVGWIITAINLVMLLGIPIFGGHYLVDMIAGAMVFAVSAAVVRHVPKLLSQNLVTAMHTTH